MTQLNQAFEAARRTGVAAVVALVIGCGSSGGGGNPAPTNHPPTVSTVSAAAPNPAVAGDVVHLSATATDPDGDSLTYTWSQLPPSPAGTFGTQGASTTWTAPAVTAGTSFSMSVSVSDGHGGSVSRSASLYVKTAAVPTLAADVEPILNGNGSSGCTGCHSSAGIPPHLAPNTAWAATVGVLATQGCTTQHLVEPGDPDASVLIKRITGTTCGTRMPPDQTDYFDTHPGELATIREWIAAGAANN